MRLAMKYGIPVFVITTARQDDDSHHVYVSHRLSLDETGDMQRDLATNVEKANMLIGEAILRHPEQWVWMHERWRKQPDTPGCERLPNIEKYE
jgi:KDO2-lipid IV(A) lauroyltransferase